MAHQFRETTVRVAGVDHVVRTDVAGRVRTVTQLESAHAKAVKAKIAELRTANLAVYRAAAVDAEAASKRIGKRWIEEQAAVRARAIVRRAERGTFVSHTSAWAADLRPTPKFRFTGEIPDSLVEIEPDHYATFEAAEQLALI
ncbi:hypothetical protein OG906_41345 (plasmid) [Streptomyces sp. NBC_01426]|uniref:hypothetical protein n=1 Tax=Streptomyces sp. NBC_01426 TaxID=2975866 RepID=UPI002E31970A|nr:hypothetical protein [Streptomyces sp. NBC_01426]